MAKVSKTLQTVIGTKVCIKMDIPMAMGNTTGKTGLPTKEILSKDSGKVKVNGLTLKEIGTRVNSIKTEKTDRELLFG